MVVVIYNSIKSVKINFSRSAAGRRTEGKTGAAIHNL